MLIFEKSVIINCSLRELFEFHTDVDNLIHLSKFRGMRVKLLKANLPIAKGSELLLKITDFGIYRTKWHLRVTSFTQPDSFSDEMIKGPFKTWKHTHKFEETGTACKMTDIIEYEMPFGFLGDIFQKLFFKRMLNDLFDFRHKLTKKFLEK